MEDIDFQSFPGYYEEVSSDDETSMKEIEAELYSRIHYEEHIDLELPPEVTNSLPVEETNTAADSGCCSLKDSASEDSTPERRRDDAVASDSKYESGCHKEDIVIVDDSSSDESEEDSGIQILQHYRPGETSKVPEVVDINDGDSSSSSSSCDSSSSSVTQLPMPPVVTPKTVCNPQNGTEDSKIVRHQNNSSTKIVRHQNNSSTPLVDLKKGKVVGEKKVSRKRKADFYISDPDSSSSSSDCDDDVIIPTKLSLNLRGSWGNSRVERTFDEVVGSSSADGLNGDVQCNNWTEDMYTFYNEIDSQMVDITLDDILNSLPDDGNWTVRKPHATVGTSREVTRYFNGRKCTNCYRAGHNAKSCPEPKRRLVCYICTEEGHVSTRCPDQACLRCGQPGVPNYNSCYNCRYLDNTDCYHCGGKGHTKATCSDHWRRYHATTKGGCGVTVPQVDVHVPARQSSCPNCARTGHYLHQCRAYTFSNLPLPVLTVVSYRENNQLIRTTSDNESNWVKRKRLREELKSKKRAYRSMPGTPKHASNGTYSEPSTPKNHIDMNVAEALLQAQNTLASLAESGNNWRDKKRQKKKSFTIPKDDKIFLSTGGKKSRKEKRLKANKGKNGSSSYPRGGSTQNSPIEFGQKHKKSKRTKNANSKRAMEDMRDQMKMIASNVTPGRKGWKKEQKRVFTLAKKLKNNRKNVTM